MNKFRQKQAGISLIEVLIAVVILSFGMLALASLQGQMLRAGGETKARSAAATFAQGQIEAMRAFRTLYAGAPCGASNPYCDYQSIKTGSFGGTAAYEVGGVTYYGCTQVRRFRMDPVTSKFVGPAGTLPQPTVSASGTTCTDLGDPNAGSIVSASIPEFKEITATVMWVDPTGQNKSVQLTDSVAAISPDDALELAKSPPESVRGPEQHINRSALTNTPGIVPIATGQNRTSASTNPTPTQFVDSLSSLTSFDVMSFVGTSDPDILKVTRSIPMSAVSCVCSTGAVSSDSAPAFEPAVWNGKRLGYDLPARKPNGLPIGTYNGSNSDAGISTICTVCCRDHQDYKRPSNADDPNLRVDPYRTPASDGSHQHYGFKKQGQGYVIDGGLLPVGADTNNEYVEACKVIEVGGRLRLAVDARQNDMTIAPMNSSQSGYEQADFVDRYSSFVRDYVSYAVNGVISGSVVNGNGDKYPIAPASLPPLNDTIKANHSTILQPSPLSYANYPSDRKLLSFGLYVDYLSKDTLAAYKCAHDKDPSSACDGYRDRDELEFIPLFALNLASLGTWGSKPYESIVQIDGATYNPQGRLAKQGGLAHWGAGSNDTAVDASEQINISNSGLTATVPVDDDDAASTSLVTDLMGFLKKAGVVVAPPVSLDVSVAASSTITLQKLGVSSPVGVTPCNYTPSKATSTCTVQGAATSTALRISNYTTQEKVKGVTVVHDRKVCLPNDSRLISATTYNAGTIDEYVDVTLIDMNTTDHVLVIEVQDESGSCDQSKVTLTPL